MFNQNNYSNLYNNEFVLQNYKEIVFSTKIKGYVTPNFLILNTLMIDNIVRACVYIYYIKSVCCVYIVLGYILEARCFVDYSFLYMEPNLIYFKIIFLERLVFID